MFSLNLSIVYASKLECQIALSKKWQQEPYWDKLDLKVGFPQNLTRSKF